MVVYYSKVRITKEFPDSCFPTTQIVQNVSKITQSQSTSDNFIASEFTDTITKNTNSFTVIEETSEFGGPCNETDDCNYSTYTLSNGTIVNSIACQNSTCFCLYPYSLYFLVSSSNKYYCKLNDGDPCIDKIQCASGTCNPSHNKCT